jgi:hypothetical protein
VKQEHGSVPHRYDADATKRRRAPRNIRAPEATSQQTRATGQRWEQDRPTDLNQTLF